MSLHDPEKIEAKMLSAGASAYLSKDQAFETLCETIQREFKAKKAGTVRLLNII